MKALEKFVEKPSDALGIIALHQIGSDGNFRRRTRGEKSTNIKRYYVPVDFSRFST